MPMQTEFRPGDVLYVFKPGRREPVAALLVDDARETDGRRWIVGRGSRGVPSRFHSLGNGLWRGPGGLWRFEPAPDEPDHETLAAWNAVAASATVPATPGGDKGAV